MIVRQGDGNDVAAIMPVMETAFDSEYAEGWTASQCLATLSMPGSRLLCAETGENIVGFALSRWIQDEEELLLIAVATNMQRKGVARKLVDSIIVYARDCGRTEVFLEVRDGNPAYYFYQKAGFVPVGRRNGYYCNRDGSKRDAITMSLQLNATS